MGGGGLATGIYRQASKYPRIIDKQWPITEQRWSDYLKTMIDYWQVMIAKQAFTDKL